MPVKRILSFQNVIENPEKKLDSVQRKKSDRETKNSIQILKWTAINSSKAKKEGMGPWVNLLTTYVLKKS